MAHRSNLRPGDVLQGLYESEINASVQTFFDGGFTAKIGDDWNGWEAEETLPTMVDAEAWLDRTARELRPESLYALGREEFNQRRKQEVAGLDPL